MIKHYNLIILLLFIFTSITIGRIFTALDPGAGDARLFLYLGQQWAQGRLPYLAVWEPYPPGIIAVTALVHYFFPNNHLALAVVEGVFVGACILAIFGILRNAAAPFGVSALASAAAAMATSLLFYNQRGVTAEIYSLAPATLSMLFFLKGLEKPKWLLISGLLCGIAGLFKPIGLTPYLAQISILLWLLVSGRRQIHPALKHATLVTVGMLAPWVFVFLYFDLHDAGYEFLSTSFESIEVVKNTYPRLADAVNNLLRGTAPLASLGGCLIVLIYLQLKGKLGYANGSESDEHSIIQQNLNTTTSLFLIWTLANLVAVPVEKYSSGHYLVLAPGLSVIAGLAYWRLVGSEKANTSPLQRTALISLILMPLLFYHVVSSIKIINNVTRWPSVSADDRQLIRYLAENQSPDDSLFSWSHMPTIYQGTDIRPAFKFLSAEYPRPTMSFRTRRNILLQILPKLREHPPTYILDTTPNSARPSKRNVTYRQFLTLLSERYGAVYTRGHYKLYKLH